MFCLGVYVCICVSCARFVDSWMLCKPCPTWDLLVVFFCNIFSWTLLTLEVNPCWYRLAAAYSLGLVFLWIDSKEAKETCRTYLFDLKVKNLSVPVFLPLFPLAFPRYPNVNNKTLSHACTVRRCPNSCLFWTWFCVDMYFIMIH